MPYQNSQIIKHTPILKRKNQKSALKSLNHWGKHSKFIGNQILSQYFAQKFRAISINNWVLKTKPINIAYIYKFLCFVTISTNIFRIRTKFWKHKKEASKSLFYPEWFNFNVRPECSLGMFARISIPTCFHEWSLSFR